MNDDEITMIELTMTPPMAALVARALDYAGSATFFGQGENGYINATAEMLRMLVARTEAAS